MKKSLFAVAALTAIAGGAQAQSSVTVYGIMDAGYVGYNARVAGASSVARATGSGFGDGAESTSRLGFKGTEDLGGGMSAFFTVELGLNLDTAQVINTGVTQNRQSFVGLKKNGLGDFAFGTQYTLLHNAVAATDAGQTNNIMGDMIYTADKTATGGNNPTIYNASTTSSSSYAMAQGNDAGLAYTIRQNNMLTANTANFGGFVGHAFYMLNQTNTNETNARGSAAGSVTGGPNNYSGWGLGGDYTFGKAYATVAYQSFVATNPYAPLTAGTTSTLPVPATNAPVAFGAGQGSLPGLNVRDNQLYAAATYDFGILKAYAQYINRKYTSQLDATQFLSRTGEQIGVRSFITPTVEAWAQGGLGRYQLYGASQPNANLTSFQIGSNYWLSKRTNLYAIYGQYATSNVTPVGTAGATSFNANNYALGVRHTF